MIQTIKPKNYIAPFFGLKADSTLEELKAGLSALKETGITSATVEYSSSGMQLTRFDDAFFAAADRLCEACREVGMTFRLQDAAPFPTGGANGVLSEPEYAHLNKVFIDERHMEVYGPYPGAVIRTGDLLHVINSAMLADPARLDTSDRKKVCIVAYRLLENNLLDEGSAILLDKYEKDGFLTWDVPEGYWRISVLFTTTKSPGRKNYINLISKESVQLQIDKVHKPIYEHLKGELGRVWDGFFYDEPEIGNNGAGMGGYDFRMLPGKRQQDHMNCDVFPWSPEMPEEMAGRDPEWLKKLVYLFFDSKGSEASGFRYHYMDALTMLLRENYNGQVHAWCLEHGVPYVGHVLEDENSHTRLGCGAGHFFRVEYHQDRAGVDLISAQVMPGNDRGEAWYGAANGDGEFFHYGLAKLASSAAHISPIQHNRSLCEVFAIYGPMNGPKMRKFLVDHLLVNGINSMVFAESNRFGLPAPYYKEVSDYTNYMCELLNASEPVIKTAVLYHAESEWCGEYQPFSAPAGELARGQISYDVIPADAFAEPGLYRKEVLDSYQALIVPSCEYIPEAAAAFIRKAAETGFPVFFVDRIPEKICGSGADAGLADLVNGTVTENSTAEKNSGISAESVRCLQKAELASAVRSCIHPDFALYDRHDENAVRFVRYAHFKKEETDFYLVHNENPRSEVHAAFTFDRYGKQDWCAVDLMSGSITPVPEESAVLDLAQYQMLLLVPAYELPVMGIDPAIADCLQNKPAGVKVPEIREIKQEVFDGAGNPVEAENITPAFSGCFVYTFAFNLDKIPETDVEVDLGAVYESCRLQINGHCLGYRITPPYRYRIPAAEAAMVLRKGTNELQITVYNNPVNYDDGHRVFGMKQSAIDASAYMTMEPSGLIGPVRIKA